MVGPTDGPSRIALSAAGQLFYLAGRRWPGSSVARPAASGSLVELARSPGPQPQPHPRHPLRYPTPYYWSVAQSEWASDVMFRRRAELERLFPRWTNHAVTTFGAVDILRFLGRQIPLQRE